MTAEADGEALRQAVLAAPRDDGPRLVYADWLTERGDPRGEFITVQCALARAPSPKLRKRDKQLLAKFGARWFGWIDELGQDVVIERGFVRQLAIVTEAFCARGAELLDREPVERLQLRHGLREASASPLVQRVPSIELLAPLQTLPAYSDMRHFLLSRRLDHIEELVVEPWFHPNVRPARLPEDLFAGSKLPRVRAWRVAGPAWLFDSIAQASAPQLERLVLAPRTALAEVTLSAIRTAHPSARIRVARSG